MKLILNGGGIGEKCRLSYQKFAQLVNDQAVLFIPLANNEDTPENSLEWFKKEVEPYGITNIEMVSDTKKLTKKYLEKFGGVYFSGGNAFLLLSLLKSCNAFNEVNDFLQTDCVVMGASAGTTVFGKDINSCLKDDLKIIASDENIVNIKDTKGFNAAEGFSFFVHYRVKERQYEATEMRIQRLLAEGHHLICLPEETSLFIENGKMSIIGDLPAEVITKNFRKVFNPGEVVDNSFDLQQEI